MKRSITVPGTGRARLAPDVAEVRLGVTVTRPTVAEARQAAAESATAILAALAAAGVDRGDVRTVGLSVQPEVEYDGRSPRVTGHQVSHRYLVTVRDLDALGRVVDGSLAAGATTLDGVSFRAKDPATAEAAARVAAVADARQRAEILASEAGVALGPVLAVVESTAAGGAPRPMVLARAMVAAESAPTPIEAGTDELTVSVVVRFAIR